MNFPPNRATGGEMKQNESFLKRHAAKLNFIRLKRGGISNARGHASAEIALQQMNTKFLSFVNIFGF